MFDLTNWQLQNQLGSGGGDSGNPHPITPRPVINAAGGAGAPMGGAAAGYGVPSSVGAMPGAVGGSFAPAPMPPSPDFGSKMSQPSMGGAPDFGSKLSNEPNYPNYRGGMGFGAAGGAHDMGRDKMEWKR